MEREYELELYHYGVKGMKWGVRKKYYNDDGSLNERGQARQAYKDARKATRTAKRELRRAGRTAFGAKGLANYKSAEKKANAAAMKELDAKANYKSKMARNEKAAAKAEFKTYKKALRKNGLPGSISDDQSKGQSTRIYNNLKAKKGKVYADKVVSRLEKELMAEIAVSTAVAIGASMAPAIAMSLSD